MPGSQVSVDLTGDAAKLFQEFHKIVTKAAEMERGLGKIAGTSRKAKKEQTDLARVAKRVTQENLTPQERYNQKIRELGQLLGKGKITQETYGRGVAKARTEMGAAIKKMAQMSPALRKIAEDSKKAKEKQLELARAGKRIYEETRTPQERYHQKLRELGRLLKARKIDQDTYGRATRRAKTEMQNAGRTGHQAFGPRALAMLRNFGSALGLTGGIAGGVMLIRKEFETLIETQQKIKDISMTTADAQIAALRNLGATTVKEREQFVKSIKELSTLTGVTPRDLYMRTSAALSARGALAVQVALAAVRESALLAPEDAAQGTAIAGAALDLAKITGTRDPKKNIGLLMAIGQTARVVEVGKLAENVMPAVTGITARGGTAREAGAIWSALTAGMADPTGRKAGTAAISLAEKLTEFFAEKKIEAPTTLARIQRLQVDPELRAAFLKQATFQVKAQASIEQMVSGQGATAEALRDYLKRIPTAEEAGPIYQQRLGVLRGAPLQRTAQMARRLEATLEQLQLADQPAARTATARERLSDILQATNLGWAATRLEQLRFEGAPEQLDTFRAQAMEARTRLTTPKAAPRRRITLTAIQGEQPPTPIGLRQAEVLDGLIRFLDQFGRATKKLDEAADKLNSNQFDQATDKLDQAARNLNASTRQRPILTTN